MRALKISTLVLYALAAALLLAPIGGCGAGLFAPLDQQNVGGQTRVVIELPSPPDAKGNAVAPVKLTVTDAKDKTDFKFEATFACAKDGSGISGIPDKIRPCTVKWEAKSSLGSRYAEVRAAVQDTMSKVQGEVAPVVVDGLTSAIMRILAPPTALLPTP